MQWHCDSMAYDEKNGYILTRSNTFLFVYTVDLENKTFTKVRQIPSMGSVSMGHDDITDLFAAYDNNRHLKIYTREQFYAGKSWDTTKNFLVEGTNDSVMIRQPGEAFGNYYYSVFSVHTTDFKFAGERHIKGNSIAVINMETGKIERQLYCGDTSAELQEVDFDSQGNLYVNRWDGTLYKTSYNAYAEGNISTTPSSLIESIANIVTYRINIFSDWLQSLLESLETEEDVSQINLTYSANEIITDESLQNIIQVEYVENESQEGSGQENTEQKNLKIDEEIKSKVDNKNGEEVMVYTNQTPIPSIKVSLDSACTNKLTLFDINFLDMSNTNQNKVWQLIKNVVYVSSRITLYLCVILLIGIIIYRSILLVLSTMGYKPKKAAESKKIIDNFITAIVIMIFVYVIIQLCINFYNFMLDFVVDKMTNGLNTPYIYRVKVSDIYYFNTNGMGYLKYMSLSSDIWGAFISSLVRLIVTLLNGAACLIMAARTILIGVLITLAPITAINYLAGRVPSPEMGWMNILFFENFFKVFMMALWIPFLILFGSWMFFYII